MGVASVPGLPLTCARFNCAGVGKSKLGEGLGARRLGLAPGMIRHVRRRSVVGQYLARAPWCRRGTLFS